MGVQLNCVTQLKVTQQLVGWLANHLDAIQKYFPFNDRQTHLSGIFIAFNASETSYQSPNTFFIFGKFLILQ